MKRPLVGLVVALAALCGLSACTPAPSPTPTGPVDPGSLPLVELISPVNSSPFWDEVKRGAMAAGKDLKVTVLFNGPTKADDKTGYMKLLRAALKHKPIGIGVAPQAAALSEAAPALTSATSLGIHVVAVNSPLTGSDVPIATVQSNNQWIGENAAKQVGKLVKGHGSVVVLTDGSDPATTARADAFAAYLKKNDKNVKVVATKDGGSSRASAKKAAASVLAANPGVTGVFGTNGPTTLGLADAVAAKKSKPVVVGVDAESDEVKLVSEGAVAGAYAQNAFNIGYQTVRTIVDASKGTMPTDKTLFSDVVWYTKSNLKDPAVVQILQDSAK